MLNFKIDQLKSSFFDSAKVVSALDKATRKALSKFGAFVRTSARSSIRRRKGISKPGNPPNSHQGDLKKILFAYDAQRQSVVVGPLRFSGKRGFATKALEHGGTMVVERKRKSRVIQKTVQVAARPFMAPAFQKNLPQLPELWRNQLNRS